VSGRHIFEAGGSVRDARCGDVNRLAP